MPRDFLLRFDRELAQRCQRQQRLRRRLCRRCCRRRHLVLIRVDAATLGERAPFCRLFLVRSAILAQVNALDYEQPRHKSRRTQRVAT